MHVPADLGCEDAFHSHGLWNKIDTILSLSSWRVQPMSDCDDILSIIGIVQ